MPQPFSVHAGDDLGTDLGSWDDQGNITIPGDLTVGGAINGTISGVVDTVTAADGTIVVGGTATHPTVKVGTGIAESSITNLTTDLAAKAPKASPTFTGTLTAADATLTGVLLAAGAYVCTSSTRPGSPAAGQVVIETDTGGVAIYVSSAWSYCAQISSLASAEAQYSAASGQSIPSSTDTTVAFGTADRTTSLVTRATSGAGHQFTLNRSGVWAVHATIRYPGFNGLAYASIDSSTGDHQSSQSDDLGGNKGTLAMGTTKWYASGTILHVDAFQNNATAQTLDYVSGWVRINLAWLHG